MPLATWIRGFVLGVLKQSPLSLDEFTMAAIFDAYIGHTIGENVKARTQWETARFVSFVTLKSAGNKRMHKPQDLIKFEWEQEDKKGTGNNAWTKAEIEQLKKQKPNWFK